MARHMGEDNSAVSFLLDKNEQGYKVVSLLLSFQDISRGTWWTTWSAEYYGKHTSKRRRIIPYSVVILICIYQK